MTPKSKVDAVIREFIDNCKYVPVDAVTSIISQLGTIADSLGDEEYRREQIAVGISHIASGMNADNKPEEFPPIDMRMPNVCEWSSKDIGEEVFKQIISSYLNDDLQVVRILVSAMDDEQFEHCIHWVTGYKNEQSYHWPVNVDWNEFITCLIDYHNGK